MTENNYTPFSKSSSLISTDIQQYIPGEANTTTQSYQCNTPKTHCYVCGTGWGEGYWKHCWCKPNTVPIGDGLGVMIVMVIAYSVLKYLKRL